MRYVENHLAGRSIAFDGDSICCAKTETAETLNRGWAYRVARDNDMRWANYAVSGGTVTAEMYVASDGSPRHWVSRNIDRVFAEHPELDYYIFEGGTNDADLLEHTPERWGTFSESDFSGNYDDSTFCGAFEALIYRALSCRPMLKIGYIVAPKMGTPADGYGMNNIRYRFFRMAMDICRKWGVPYLDLWNECPLNPMLKVHFDRSLDTEANRAAGSLYLDGQHLTARGYDAVTPRIEAFIKTL